VGHILEVPIDEIGFAVGIEVASGNRPGTTVATGRIACMVVDGLFKGPIAIA